MSDDEVERIRRWHERAHQRLTSNRQATSFVCLGLQVSVPPGVFPPIDADFLGAAVRDEANAGDRVLDVGTGSGINALLAAQKTSRVVAVDINPAAVEAAKSNAARNGLADKITFAVSDLYDSVDGVFDLIVFNPPFRWFKPRDAAEATMADENYNTLRRFMRETVDRLSARGRVVISFGTSGDMLYLKSLIESNDYDSRTVATNELTQDGHTVSYFVLRLSRR